MRDSNYSFPTQNRVCVNITNTLYDRRALDTSSMLPLLNSLTHLTYLSSTSPRIREILVVDGGLERLLEILIESALPRPVTVPEDWWALKGPSTAGVLTPQQQNMLKHSLAFQCVVNIGVRGSEAIRTRVVQAGTLDVVAQIMEVWLKARGLSIVSGPLGSQAAVNRAAAVGHAAMFPHGYSSHHGHRSYQSAINQMIQIQYQIEQSGALADPELLRRYREHQASFQRHLQLAQEAAQHDRIRQQAQSRSAAVTAAAALKTEADDQEESKPKEGSSSGGGIKRERERSKPSAALESGAGPSFNSIHNSNQPSQPGRRTTRSWWPASLLRNGTNQQEDTAHQTRNPRAQQTQESPMIPSQEPVDPSQLPNAPRIPSPSSSRGYDITANREQLARMSLPEDRVTDDEIIEHALTSDQRREIQLINTLARISNTHRDHIWRAYESQSRGWDTIREHMTMVGLDVRSLAPLYEGSPFTSGTNRTGGARLSNFVEGFDALTTAPAAQPLPHFPSVLQSSPLQASQSRSASQRAMSIDPPVAMESQSVRRPIVNFPEDEDDVQMDMDEYIERSSSVGLDGESVVDDNEEERSPVDSTAPPTAISRRDTIGPSSSQSSRSRRPDDVEPAREHHTPRAPSAPLPIASSQSSLPSRPHRGLSTNSEPANRRSTSRYLNDNHLSDTNLAHSVSSTASDLSSVDDSDTQQPPSRGPSRPARHRHPLAHVQDGLESNERSNLSTPVNTPPPAQTSFVMRERQNTLTGRNDGRLGPGPREQLGDSHETPRAFSRAGTEDDDGPAGDNDEEEAAVPDDQTIGIVGTQDDDALLSGNSIAGLGDTDPEAQAQAQVDLAMGAPPGAPGAAPLATPRLTEMTPRQAFRQGPLPTMDNIEEQSDQPANGALATDQTPVPPAQQTPPAEPFVVIAAGAPRGFHDLSNLVSLMETAPHYADNNYTDDTILLCLQLLAYLSKYPHVRTAFHHPRRPIHPGVEVPSDALLPERPALAQSSNIFSLVERFTFNPSPSDPEMQKLPTDIQYWAGVIMRNACRKDDLHGGIRQCAHMSCGKWENFPREFAKCRRCRKAKYCSKECQSKAWQEGHRFWCNAREPEAEGGVAGTLIIGGSSGSREIRERHRGRRPSRDLLSTETRPTNAENGDAMDMDPRQRSVVQPENRDAERPVAE